MRRAERQKSECVVAAIVAATMELRIADRAAAVADDGFARVVVRKQSLAVDRMHGVAYSDAAV